MERQPYPPPGSCVAKNSQRPASVKTIIIQGGVPPYGVKDTLVVNNITTLKKFCHSTHWLYQGLKTFDDVKLQVIQDFFNRTHDRFEQL